MGPAMLALVDYLFTYRMQVIITLGHNCWTSDIHLIYSRHVIGVESKSNFFGESFLCDCCILGMLNLEI